MKQNSHRIEQHLNWSVKSNDTDTSTEMKHLNLGLWAKENTSGQQQKLCIKREKPRDTEVQINVLM